MSELTPPAHPAAEHDEQRSASLPWLIAGVCGLALSGLVAWVSWSDYPLGTLDRPGPGFFPLLVAVMLAVTSVMALLEARGATYSHSHLSWRRLGLTISIVLGGAVLLPYVGFIPVAFLGGLVLAVLIERQFRWPMVPTMAVMAVAIYAIFEYLLGIRLPGLSLF